MILELPLALIVRENRIIAYNLVNKSLARAKLKVAWEEVSFKWSWRWARGGQQGGREKGWGVWNVNCPTDDEVRWMRWTHWQTLVLWRKNVQISANCFSPLLCAHGWDPPGGYIFLGGRRNEIKRKAWFNKHITVAVWHSWPSKFWKIEGMKEEKKVDFTVWKIGVADGKVWWLMSSNVWPSLAKLSVKVTWTSGLGANDRNIRTLINILSKVHTCLPLHY